MAKTFWVKQVLEIRIRAVVCKEEKSRSRNGACGLNTGKRPQASGAQLGRRCAISPEDPLFRLGRGAVVPRKKFTPCSGVGPACLLRATPKTRTSDFANLGKQTRQQHFIRSSPKSRFFQLAKQTPTMSAASRGGTGVSALLRSTFPFSPCRAH
jgi:hypothetical protein